MLLRLHRRGLGFARMDWLELANAVDRHRPRVLSLDVFDTCLIRDLATDRPIEAAIVHRRGLDERPDVDHAEILEREMCRPVPGAVQALPRIRAAGVRVVFVSDTDRSSDLLSELLRTHGLLEPGDLVIASCEEGATKAGGDLLREVFGPGGPVIDGQSVSTDLPLHSEIWHAGNNPWADGTMAARARLRPVELPEAELNRYENVIAAKSTGVGPAVAGAARRVRLEIDSEVRSGLLSPRRAEVQVLGADVAGQALIAFDLWVADQCRRNEVEHLAFLARDGELPLLVAQTMPADHWGGRPMSYLHCSRMIWGLASASAVGIEHWLAAGTSDDQAFLEVNRHDIPFHLLLSRIGLEVNELARFSAADRLRTIPSDQPLPHQAVDAWHELLFDSEVGGSILERSRQRRALLTDYLRSQGVDRGRLALVDVGWRGRLAWHISSVLRDLIDHEPIHLHFGGDKVIPDVDQEIDIRRFAFDGHGEPTAVSRPVSAVETLTASGKPRVIDYRRDASGEVELIFDQISGPEHGDRVDLWNGALRVAAALPSAKNLESWGIECDHLGTEVADLLGRWWNEPTPSEAKALARLAFEHDEAGASIRPLATPYSLSEVLAPSARQWPQGSEAITSWPLRLLVRAARSVKVRIAPAPRSGVFSRVGS